jgi:FKBP-type peptidyl-prolyl cis-trans isomerase 2
MRQAKHGDTVRVHYRGKLCNGSVFDDSFDREPLQFTIGGGEIMPGFEEAVVGMNPGDLKTTEVSAEKAFGPYQEDMLVVVDKSEFPEDVEPKVGQSVPISRPDGPPIDLTVAEVTESEVTLDANHPLAGEDLSFDIELIDIVYGAH